MEEGYRAHGGGDGGLWGISSHCSGVVSLSKMCFQYAVSDNSF